VSKGTVADVRHASRVLVYGVTGSGKTRAALRLGEVLGLRVHLVDEEVGWLPGWEQRPVPEQRVLVARMVAQDGWVLDSAYSGWSALVLARAQVVLALDYPRAVSLGRLLRRTAVRWVRGTEVCNGNRERLRDILARDSVLLWHFRSFRRKRVRIREWESRPDGIPVVRLTHPRALDDLVAALRVGEAGERRLSPP
jgi:adenylate kinase family enzyme